MLQFYWYEPMGQQCWLSESDIVMAALRQGIGDPGGEAPEGESPTSVDEEMVDRQRDLDEELFWQDERSARLDEMEQRFLVTPCTSHPRYHREIWWTGLAPWLFGLPFPGSLIYIYLHMAGGAPGTPLGRQSRRLRTHVPGRSLISPNPKP